MTERSVRVAISIKNPVAQQLACEMFSTTGVQIDVFDDAAAILDEADTVQAIVLGLDAFPEETLEALALLRERLATIPIFVIAAAAGQRHTERAELSGATQVIPYSYLNESLAKTMRDNAAAVRQVKVMTSVIAGAVALLILAAVAAMWRLGVFMRGYIRPRRPHPISTPRRMRCPMSTWPLLLLLLLGTCAEAVAQAEQPEPLLDGLTGRATELWQQSQQQAGDLWQRSRESADDWWQRSRDATLGAWEDARDSLTPEEADDFGRVWTNVVPKLEQTVSLEEAQRDLPDRAWFRRDKADAEAEINQLLNESVAILSTSPMQRYRDEIQSLEQRIEAARTDIDAYRKDRVAAPTKSLTAKTVGDFDRLIDEREQDIRRYRVELDKIKREFAAELRAMGLELSDEQVEFLLSTVVGDNIVDLGIVFDNVKAITVQLEQLVRDSGEDMQSARRYYGMYVVLLRALNRMHLDVEQAIEQRYIPQINDIAKRADSLSDETRTLAREHPEKAPVLQANLEAQRLTIEAAGVYRDYLKQQAAQVRGARVALEEDIATAWNTYETVRVSGELVDLVKSSQQLLEGLLDRQVPALRPFQNLEMQREFAKLTEQLRAANE